MRSKRTAPIRLLALLVVSTLLVQCGGGGDSAAPPPPKVVATLELAPTTLNLAPGQSSTLVATPREATGAAITGKTISWVSSNVVVATVSSTGQVTALNDGTTQITAAVDGRTATAAVTVRTPVASVVVSPGTAQVTVGGATAQLTAVARDAAGGVLNGRTVVWSSANNTIATVSQSGVVTAVGAGTVNVTATVDGVAGTSAITSTVNPCAVVRPMLMGDTFGGTLASGDCRLTDQSAVQRFEFTVATATKVEITMNSSVVDPYLFLQDNALAVIDEDDDGGVGANARIMRILPPGRYIISANTYDANSFGAFQLNLRLAPAACSTGPVLNFPATRNATLQTTACRLNDDSYEDRYELTVGARTTLTMAMSTPVFDAFLVVMDDSENLVAWDDDGGGGLNAALEVQLEPGRYFILAQGYPGETGAYQLAVAAANDPCAATRTLALGQSVTNTMAVTDCQFSDGGGPTRFLQRYRLTLPTATSVQIDMTSSAIDAYVVVQNANTGAVVAENDDVSPQSTNSRVIVNLLAGEYIVNATTYGANETGPFQLTASAISNPAVNVTINPASISLQPGSTQQATATVSGSANTTVVWSSSSPGIASVTSTGLVRALTPGVATITAASQADPSRVGTATVTVSGSGGTTNVDIAALYLVQSVQQLDGRIPLIADRQAVARVFVRGSRTGIGSVNVRLRFYQGATLLSTLTGSTTPTLTVDESCCSANIAVPGTLMQNGVSILADVDPTNALAESNESDNQYPLSGTPQSLTVVAVPPFNLKLVPVQQNRTGQAGTATQTLLTMFRSVWPLNVINVTTRAPLSIDYAVTSAGSDAWVRLVRDVEIARQTEGSNAYYYGLLRSQATSGLVGLANGIPALTAIGIDEQSSFGADESRLTFAHELGHTLSLRHAPCGGAAGPDPNFPFADGRTGVFGMDTYANNALKLPSFNDLMTYCSPNEWVSAYYYRKVMDFRVQNPNGIPQAPSRVLMVSGRVDAASVALDPSFAVDAPPSRNDPNGRFIAEGVAADGRVLFRWRFTPYRVEDARQETEAFVVAVPVSAAVQPQIAQVVVREAGGARGDRRSRAPGSALRAGPGAPVATVKLPGGGSQISWSSSTYPLVLVRDRVTGDVLAMARNGTLDLSAFGRADRLQVLMSDGVGSVTYTIDPVTGALRQ